MMAASRRRVWVFLLTSITFACAKGEPLTLRSLQHGENLWLKQAMPHYEIKLTISGDRIQSGDFVSEVKDDIVVHVTRNGESISSKDPFYSIPGMFQFLQDELDMSKDPQRYWNASKGARLYQRAHFDPGNGFVRRYLRSVSGVNHGILIDIHAVRSLL
jgi:hypothetical protein